MTLGEKIISFNRGLQFNDKLPHSIQVMNPFKENAQAISITEQFYRKFYNDNETRTLILGINPGRFGAGLTGIPFTDPFRLKSFCNIDIDSEVKEPSAEFVYNVIEKFGGVIKFYSKFYINSVCPLGFTRPNKKGKQINCNYYEFPDLINVTCNFIIQHLKEQLKFGLNSDVCYCMGKTDNFNFLIELNKKEKFFGDIVPLPHPSYVMRKRSQKEFYMNEYLKILDKK